MNYKNINDYEQIYLIRENDEEARMVVFNKYKPIVISIANKYYDFFKGYGIDMEDLIQEGMVGLYHAVDAFKDDQSACFYTFSSLCIEREIKSYCRKFTSKKNQILNTAYSIDKYDDEEINIYSNIIIDNSIYNPDIYLDNNYIYDELIKFKNKLPLKQSLVFELRFNGFKYREISSLLDISINSVDLYLKKCKENLIKYLYK